MRFNLPDLGEGLKEAELLEWHVAEGDPVQQDQLLLSVETAKAVVDVPSPVTGRIDKILAAAGTTLSTGQALVEIAETGHSANGSVASAPDVSEESSATTAAAETSTATSNPPSESATVVGELKVAEHCDREDQFKIGSVHPSATEAHQHKLQVAPALRALADELELKLEHIEGHGEHGEICPSDLAAAIRTQLLRHSNVTTGAMPTAASGKLRGNRRDMAQVMSRARDQIVTVSLFDRADIEHWPAGSDTSVRLCRAIVHACTQVPLLNGHFDGDTLTLSEAVHLGLAVDTHDALLVPVIRDVHTLSDPRLRRQIDALKQAVSDNSLTPDQARGATISLSNFGAVKEAKGRYATPVVVPPQLAIVAAGPVNKEVVASADGIAVHHCLPLSLSFDHRAVTGAEAARFLGALIHSLES